MSSPHRASLFITCLTDLLFPRVGECTVRVLRHFGVDVEFPVAQTCCGQPAFNAGFRAVARRAARHFLEVFGKSEAIICPSGSCTSMIKEYYSHLFEDDPELRAAFEDLGSRTWELSQFLTEVLGVREIAGVLGRSVTWHDSCHSLRALHVREGPRRLLRSLSGPRFIELDDAETCCGFGGLFSVKFDAISAAMLDDKVACIERTGADCVAATDSSCLMHIGGGLERRGSRARPVHLAELLAESLGLTGGDGGRAE